MRIRSSASALLVLLLATGSMAAAGEGAATALAIGEPAPMADTKMKNVDGTELSIQAMTGQKGFLVIFTCNECPWAKAWEERIVALGNASGARGVGVIAINSNDPALAPGDNFDAMQRRARERGMQFPYVVDTGSKVAKAIGATRTPEVILFDASGKLVYHGTIDDNAKEPDKVKLSYLKDALDAVVAGQPVPVAETKALGCSIKARS
jgi:hypothetical protein